MQILSLSSCGNYLCIVSIFGNKMHIYNTKDETLKFCIYLGATIQVLEKIFFSVKKSNYIFILKNENKFNIYKLPINEQKESECICDKYDDSNISTENKKEGGLFGFFRKFSKDKDIWESHANGELKGEIEFIDFDRDKNKDIIYINKNGELFKYHFDKKPSGNILPNLKFQWM